MNPLFSALLPFAMIRADDGDDFSTVPAGAIIRCEVTAGDIADARDAIAQARTELPNIGDAIEGAYERLFGDGMESDIAISARMGRPPLGVKAPAVRFSPDVLNRIDDLEGKHRRAIFIRAAVEAELERREQKG